MEVCEFKPFRGASADARTAFETGYLYAKRKPIFGYGNVGLTHLENFGLTDNLMLVRAERLPLPDMGAD